MSIVHNYQKMEQFGQNILCTLLNNLKSFDDLTIIQLHKFITIELHKRLDDIDDLSDCDEENDKENDEKNNFSNYKSNIDRELQNKRNNDDDYDNDHHDCNCDYECGGKCRRNKPRLSIQQQRLLKEQLDRELDEYMQSGDY
ncbi:putative ORFan [Tupanvirus deep ocean]|uniref:ORFan n=2 Tax=Tupanvirus TaxID=2094720 RepID=A0AC62AA54_9VIRU|nr:putative ORFan [Tupanvirus deep ocean]QKU34508.1 putative ORFan [Tupanvirus deep ocean]